MKKVLLLSKRTLREILLGSTYISKILRTVPTFQKMILVKKFLKLRNTKRDCKLAMVALKVALTTDSLEMKISTDTP